MKVIDGSLPVSDKGSPGSLHAAFACPCAVVPPAIVTGPSPRPEHCHPAHTCWGPTTTCALDTSQSPWHSAPLVTCAALPGCRHWAGKPGDERHGAITWTFPAQKARPGTAIRRSTAPGPLRYTYRLRVQPGVPPALTKQATVRKLCTSPSFPVGTVHSCIAHHGRRHFFHCHTRCVRKEEVGPLPPSSSLRPS
jgi:hypothetical protein